MGRRGTSSSTGFSLHVPARTPPPTPPPAGAPPAGAQDGLDKGGAVRWRCPENAYRILEREGHELAWPAEWKTTSGSASATARSTAAGVAQVAVHEAHARGDAGVSQARRIANQPGDLDAPLRQAMLGQAAGKSKDPGDQDAHQAGPDQVPSRTPVATGNRHGKSKTVTPGLGQHWLDNGPSFHRPAATAFRSSSVLGPRRAHGHKVSTLSTSALGQAVTSACPAALGAARPICPLPGQVYVRAPEVAVKRRLLIDRPAQAQVADDGPGRRSVVSIRSTMASSSTLPAQGFYADRDGAATPMA